MRNWAESKQDAPGQFTGSTGVKVLSPAELASGHQAWARRVSLMLIWVYFICKTRVVLNVAFKGWKERVIGWKVQYQLNNCQASIMQMR